MSKKNRNIISEYESEYNGQTVTIHRMKPREKKILNSSRSNLISCPNCLSKLGLDEGGLQKCLGERLLIWDLEFAKFHALDKEKQLAYLQNISFDSTFMELYDRWAYSLINPDDPFSCGYTNKIFFPIPSCSVIIPDPCQVKRIEKKLGRKLTEEEVFGEKELFFHRGGIFEKYREGAKTVKIVLLRFPEDCC